MKILIILAPFLSLTVQAKVSTMLDELYRSTLTNTSSIKDKVLELRIAQEKLSQAKSGFYPEVSLNSQYGLRDPVPSAGGFGQDKQRSTFISVDQRIFKGGAEYHGLKLAKNIPLIAELEKHRQEINVYQNLAILYFDILTQQRDLALLKKQNTTLEKQINTLSKRARIGRNKKTDVLSAQAEMARITAEISQRESQLKTSFYNLSTVTGKEVTRDLDDPYQNQILKIDSAWINLLEHNPHIKIQELLIKNADNKIKMSRANYYPDLTFNGNYYFDRFGALAESDWDMGLNLSWNLFSGGKDRSEKNISFFEKMRYQEQLKDLKREIKNNFLSLEKEFYAQKNILDRLQKAVNLSKQNYQEHLKEERQGLVNQLDVLRVQRNYLEIKRIYNRQFFDTRVTWIKLKSLAGVRP